jgi:mannosyl-3-phosphoglycerate phosphatase family protein
MRKIPLSQLILLGIHIHIYDKLIMLQKVVFTDIDGTLIDLISGKYGESDKLIYTLRENNVPIVLCSAKTFAEQNKIRDDLGLMDPFIVENGGAIIIPKNYFDFQFDIEQTRIKEEQGYIIIELGESTREIRTKLAEIKKKLKIEFKGVADVSIEELSRLATMPIDYAKRMSEREYGETILQMKKSDIPTFATSIEKMGIKVIHGGRFFDVTMGTDKGKAVSILINLFRKKYRNQIKFFGVGDSANDASMLKLMDVPMVVQKPDSSWSELEIKNVIRLKGIGPEGWKSAFDKIMEMN